MDLGRIVDSEFSASFLSCDGSDDFQALYTSNQKSQILEFRLLL